MPTGIVIAPGRAAAADALAFYDNIPSYQKVVTREGLASAVDLAVTGSADEVISRLGEYRDAGATDIVLSSLDRLAIMLPYRRFGALSLSFKTASRPIASSSVSSRLQNAKRTR